MTWDGESLMIMLCFPPNMAICKNLIKPKVPNVPRKTTASLGNREDLLELFFPLILRILTFCVVEEMKELFCGVYIHVDVPVSMFSNSSVDEACCHLNMYSW